MLKILKHGTTTYYAKCTCGCEFIYDFTEIHEGGVICPECGEKIEHKFVRYTEPATETIPASTESTPEPAALTHDLEEEIPQSIDNQEAKELLEECAKYGI